MMSAGAAFFVVALTYTMVFLPVAVLMYVFLRFALKHKPSVWKMLLSALLFVLVATMIEKLKHEIYGNGFEQTRLFAQSNLLKYVGLFASQIVIFGCLASKTQDGNIPWRTWIAMFLAIDIALLAFLNSSYFLLLSVRSSL